jgi:hypothetical protein
VAALLGTAAPVAAQSAGTSLEYQVKAAYLLNFTRYVDWPPSALGPSDAPLVICVLGADPFGAALDETVAGRRSRGREVRLQRVERPEAAAGCHVAFIGRGVTDADRWLAPLRGHPILTVGEDDRFLAEGGVVRFVTVQETIRFEVNLDAGRAADLAISSRVLSLATRVTHGAGER